MLSQLPNDLVKFLQDGRTLHYDADQSDVGPICLNPLNLLKETRLCVFPGCQKLYPIDDPYAYLNGLYEIAVIDLVAECEHYSEKGLLCWIPELDSFGSIDAEHGTVWSFNTREWQDIEREPLLFLDAQWSGTPDGRRASFEIVLLWLHFPFRLREEPESFLPYSQTCPVHERRLLRQAVPRDDFFEVYQRRERSNWIDNYLKAFPCSGVPSTDTETLYCVECRQAEDQWLQMVKDGIEILEATANAYQWVKCPGCNTRFSLSDKHQFQDGIHLSCGQKIRVVQADKRKGEQQ